MVSKIFFSALRALIWTETKRGPSPSPGSATVHVYIMGSLSSTVFLGDARQPEVSLFLFL